MILFPLLVSLISLMDLSLPAVIGMTTPGNKTVFRKGKIGKTSGRSSLVIASSSSADIKGMNSASSDKSCSDNLSNGKYLDFFIVYFRTLCHIKNDTNIIFL